MQPESKRDQWERIKRDAPDLAEFILQLTATFGKIKEVKEIERD